MYGTTNAPSGVTFEEFNDLVAVTDYVLPASGWTDSDGKFTNTIVASFKATDKPIISFTDPTGSVDLDDYDEPCGFVRYFDTGNGTLTATAVEKPTLDLYISSKGF